MKSERKMNMCANPEMKPRVGITTNLDPEFMDEIIQNGINVSYENFLKEIPHEEDSDEYQEACDMYQNDEDLYLFGDWKKTKDGYEIDKNGKEGFAMTFQSGGFGNLGCIEYSKVTKLCNKTSPCFVMADGSGPCGDLDTPGNDVTAYTLADECFYKERK
jgi:hypothetical protein